MIIVLIVIAIELLFISIHLVSIDNLIDKIGYMFAHTLDEEKKHETCD